MWNPLLLLRRRGRPDADFAQEIAAHLELEADRLVAEGLSRERAVDEAHRRFGNVGLVQEDFHRRRTTGSACAASAAARTRSAARAMS